MSEKGHGPCPYVDCGSSDAFSYNSDKMVGKCHSCSRGYPSKDTMHPWAKEKYPTMEKDGFDNLRSMVSSQPTSMSQKTYKEMRGITAKTMEEFDVVTDDFTQEYTYPSGGKKVRMLADKKFFTKDGFKGDELFGMNLFPAGCSKFVTITEGEVDAMSAWQMLKSNWTTPVVSLPSATPSKKLWENCKEWLDSFEKIILSVDNDEAGNNVADRMSRLFPNKVYRVDHGQYKDANDFLQAGKAQDFKSSWWKPIKHTPENVINTADQFLKLYEDTPEHVYVPTGIQALDDKILGLMQGHFTMFKAPTGIGKTELMRYLEYQMVPSGGVEIIHSGSPPKNKMSSEKPITNDECDIRKCDCAENS